MKNLLKFRWFGKYDCVVVALIFLSINVFFATGCISNVASGRNIGSLTVTSTQSAYAVDCDLEGNSVAETLTGSSTETDGVHTWASGDIEAGTYACKFTPTDSQNFWPLLSQRIVVKFKDVSATEETIEFPAKSSTPLPTVDWAVIAMANDAAAVLDDAITGLTALIIAAAQALVDNFVCTSSIDATTLNDSRAQVSMKQVACSKATEDADNAADTAVAYGLMACGSNSDALCDDTSSQVVDARAAADRCETAITDSAAADLNASVTLQNLSQRFVTECGGGGTPLACVETTVLVDGVIAAGSDVRIANSEGYDQSQPTVAGEKLLVCDLQAVATSVVASRTGRVSKSVVVTLLPGVTERVSMSLSLISTQTAGQPVDRDDFLLMDGQEIDMCGTLFYYDAGLNLVAVPCDQVVLSVVSGTAVSITDNGSGFMTKLVAASTGMVSNTNLRWCWDSMGTPANTADDLCEPTGFVVTTP